MEIKYLKDLRDYPSRNPKSTTYKATNQPITVSEITQLEQLYNSGKPFPKALKELLYLAGDYCHVLDYGRSKTQQELQESVRKKMLQNGRTINRPFYAIDVYNASEQFLFVYLDEGDNPAVYEGYYNDEPSKWIEKLVPDSLSQYISGQVNKVKEGRNPF